MPNVTPRDIESLVELFDRSGWDVLNLEIEGFRIHLAKNPPNGSAAINPGPLSGSIARPIEIAPDSGQPAAGAAALAHPAAAPALAAAEGNLVTVHAPNLGTFYRAPKPGAPPYVEIGHHVEPDTEICLIEVMKLFTPVRAGVRGIVRHVCVTDSEMVEGDQPLFLIEPLP
jgi:acetyl-CoA carboxylase biotin carboxyl carrier protein